MDSGNKSLDDSFGDAAAERTFPIFLSSLYGELKELRNRIYYEAGCGSEIYVDECVERRCPDQDKLEIADDLIRRVREAEVFICILGGKSHGSPIIVEARPSSVSFVEIELYQAALLEKEVYLFCIQGFDPEPKLASLLRILQFAIPQWVVRSDCTAGQILTDVKQISQRNRRWRLWGPLRPTIGRFVQALYTERVKKALEPSLLFLDGRYEARSEPPNRDLLNAVRAQIRSQTDEEKRLSRVWIGLRECWRPEFIGTLELDLLRYQNDLLSEWAKAGAWYGLHANTPLGCLAALNSMKDIRSHLAKSFADVLPSNETGYPGGALASAKYSIAKRLHVKEDRFPLFQEALEDLRLSLSSPTQEDTSGLIAVRGSILRQLGRLAEAVDDYKTVLRIRRESGAPDSAVGEALSELGFGYLRQGRLRKAMGYCEEGVELMSTARAGFRARALRKLAAAYLINGRLVKAHETWLEAKAVARRHGTFDQL